MHGDEVGEDKQRKKCLDLAELMNIKEHAWGSSNLIVGRPPLHCEKDLLVRSLTRSL